MSRVGTVVRNAHRPRFWTETVLPRVAETAMRGYYARFSPGGCDVMAEDWDTCLIVDACRYDTFAERSSIPGRLERRRSHGSTTFEFFEANFLGSTHHDTVYVTANPVPRVEKWCRVDLDEVFHDVVDVWEDHWDGEANTVRPAPVEAAVRDAHADYPDKRIIGHFLQPHQPFIGETGRRIEQRGMRAFDLVMDGEVDSRKSVWDRLEDGELDAERVRTAYRENLDLVLPHVEALCADVSGRTVVTSDHGNMIGEFAWPFPVRQYGHPPGVHTKELVNVPWLVVESDDRRDVVAEPPVGSGSAADDAERLERLSALGYR